MSQKRDVKLITALLSVAVFWGTTYLAIRIAVQSIPPWYVTGFRQLVASIIMLCWLLYKKQLRWIGWKNLGIQVVFSTLMLIVANGMTTVAEQSLPSGLTSLLSALTPIFVFLGSVLIGIQRASLKGFVGVVIGFSGVAFIFRGGLDDLLHPEYLSGIFYLLIAIIGWTVGTIYTKKLGRKSQSISLDLFYQFSFASLAQLGIALLLHPANNFSNWSANSIAAVVYLGVFGSIVGYFSYHYALKRVTATEVSILSYFNTVIAIFLGWLVLNEAVSYDLLVATFLIILGVFITNHKKENN